jgi:Tol biopolymer transport system component
MKQTTIYRLFFIILMTFSTIDCLSQVSPTAVGYPYNHLSWYTIEGDHFLIHYQEGSEKTAGAASVIANQIYRPITELYNYEPSRKVSIILRDREDYANGAAYFFDDKIDIWVPPLDTPLRGTHQWLQNVITHEFTHIVQMGASMKRTPSIQSIYLQWLSYEDVRRPDVLYGSPKGIISHPFSTVSIPAWFSEGTAQFMRENIFYDYWDSHRDMILRMNILSDSTISFEDMGDFSSKNSLEREMVYNQGFDFVRYLVEEFGESVIYDLSKASADGSNDFSKVMKSVTNKNGPELFQDWVQNRRDKYESLAQNLGQENIRTVVEDGFMNFYPQYDRQKKTFGYLSNQNRDYATTMLILETPDSTIVVDELENPKQKSDVSEIFDHFSDSNITVDQIGNRFSFSPNGKKVIYSKADQNRFGEHYQDLFVFNVDSLSEEKITKDGRIQDPSWHPSDEKIVAVKLEDGTQNLVQIDLISKEITQLTIFENGETVYTPVWSPDGQYVYFSSARENNRNLYYYSVESRQITPLFEDALIDFRDPWVDHGNSYLYFSSDLNGIYNIYRSEIDGNSVQKITDVRGGAFMPYAQEDSLYFSEYRSGGYKISATKIPDSKESYKMENFVEKSDHKKYLSNNVTEKSIFESVNNFSAFHDSLKNRSVEEVEEVEVEFTVKNNEQSFLWRPYNQTTTGLSVIPVVRFDNYSKLNGSNSKLFTNGRFGDLSKNLIRDFKAGAYFSSRDVTERLNIFAGAMFGWGSREADSFANFFSPNRLNNLDRDLFFIIDHQGIPFIKRSWSPTVSLEVYNLKRNVQNGVSIEEFSCTSCLPTQTSIDIRYHVWEANLYLRSKLNQWSLLELGASYSPYSVATDGFFSEEFKEFIPGSTTEYFKGTSYSASYIANTILPTRHADVAPEGARANVTFQLDNGRLLQEFEIDEGSLSPVYERSTNYSLEFHSQLGGEIAGDVNGLITSRIFSYFNNPENYFYLDYAGGLTGMRSYPYFAIGGQRTIWGRFSLLAPLKKDINRQIGAYTLDKLYANLFFEAGNGWGGPLSNGDNLKKGVGTELRFALNSYYIFPLKLFITTTYGFNRFNVTLPEQFISTSSENSVTYGKELLFYFGLTFDFNQL